MRVILASGSPRRRQLLAEMGIRFEVKPTDADETLPQDASPEVAAVAIAMRKAEEAAKADPDALIIAADTVVVIDGMILGKPADADEAVEMLKRLSGRWHEVLTGVCVAWRGEAHSSCERTKVLFDEMNTWDIARYVESGEPMDKAGAYGIQGGAGVFVSRIDGCYFNVMGLPKSALRKLLIRAAGEAGYRALNQ